MSELKAGDKIEITENDFAHNGKVGDIKTIKSIQGNKIKFVDGGFCFQNSHGHFKEVEEDVMSEFKIGDRVRLWELDGAKRSIVTTIVDVRKQGVEYKYKFAQWLNGADGTCFWGSDRSDFKITKVEENSMDNLKVGSIVTDSDGLCEKEVIFINGDKFLTKDIWDKTFDWNSWGSYDLQEGRLRIKGSETELTLQQVADKFNIPVSELRIKE